MRQPHQRSVAQLVEQIFWEPWVIRFRLVTLMTYSGRLFWSNLSSRHRLYLLISVWMYLRFSYPDLYSGFSSALS